MGKYNYHDFLAFIGIGGAHPGGLALTKELLKHVQINQHSKVLDAGCGTGQTATYIAQTYGCQVTGIDQHPVMIQKAKQRFDKEHLKINLIQGNIEGMPFAEASFDFILIESVTVFADIDKTVREYARLLRKGGILFDLEMTAIPPLSQEMREKFYELYGIRHIPSAKEWRDKYQQAGLHNLEIIHGNLVKKLLYEPDMPDEDVPEFFVSNSIDPSIYQIWDEHQLLTEKFADKLKYNVYKVHK